MRPFLALLRLCDTLSAQDSTPSRYFERFHHGPVPDSPGTYRDRI